MAKELEIYADSARGIYIPQFFAESIKREYVTGVSDEDWQILEAGPDAELYWETWDDVLNNAVLTDRNNTTWTLYQDGDLFLVPDGFDWETIDN